MICPYCNSKNIVHDGNRRLLNGWKQRYECKNCKRTFSERTISKEEGNVGPRILVLDVETAPMAVFTFQLKVDYINPENIITPTFILCWSAKWMGDDKIMGDVLTSEEAKRQDDSRICQSIYKLICMADLVVTYNGDKFDLPKLSYRFLVNNFPPPSEYRSIDPIKTLRYQFGFDSNKLDFTNSLMGLDKKTETNYQLWKDCYFGDEHALNEMYTYNQNDVKILEDNYRRIRPWMKRHPNIGVYFDFEGNICRICGSKEVREVLDKHHYTTVGKFPLFRCNDCGAESVGRYSEFSKEKRRGLLK